MTRTLVLAAAALLAAHGGAQAQDAPLPGQRVFNQCRACHQVGPTAKNGLGPQLNGLFGRAAGSMPGFTYSEASKTSGITWDATNFAEFVRNPKGRMPGTKMVFAGLKNDSQIAELADYLKTFAADGPK
jgi:cytochrome c